MNSVQQLHPIQLHNRLIRSVRLLAVALLMAFLWLGIFSQAAHAQDGTITFVKNAVGANGTFTFTNPDGDPDLDGLSILTTNNSGTSATFTKAAGTYTVTENALTGWALSDIEVAGDTDSGSTWSITNTQIVIDLDAGENITVTWTNADQNYTVNSAELTGVTTTGVTIGPVASGVSLQILGLDYGDLPDSDAGAGGTAVNSPSYNTNITTTSGAIGASHIITPGLHLGAGVDHESDGQPSATATGDDTNDSVAGLT
ncbi:prealbumin-like fold domain-containing protein, partial [Chloroflexi bacterium TSY]|nr:prealbumin-like fold domain-containing protein [Chloroflexi bacterium TSY]